MAKLTLTDDQITVTRLATPRVVAGLKAQTATADPDGSDGGDSDGTDK
jgi:hypothetical protein